MGVAVWGGGGVSFELFAVCVCGGLVFTVYNFANFYKVTFLTLSTHVREGYSSHFVSLSVSLSVCVSLFDLILEKATFSGLKLTSVHSR